MKFQKTFFLFIFTTFSTLCLKSNKTEVLEEQKSKIFNSFNNLISYKFSNSEYKKYQIIVTARLHELLENEQDSFLKELLNAWKFVEFQMIVWHAMNSVDDKLVDLTYRKLQQARIKILYFLLKSPEKYLKNKNFIKKAVRFAIGRKAFFKIKGYLKIEEDSLFLYKNYFLFIKELIKNESVFNFILDEEKLDKLIKSLNSKNKLEKLFLENLSKLKISLLNKLELQKNLDKFLDAKNSSKKIIIIKHHQLLSFKNFNYYASKFDLFNQYLDIVDYYLNTSDCILDSLFVFDFFQFYAQILNLLFKSKPIIPFTHIGGNSNLLEILLYMQDVLNIILQEIHESLGIGPGWIKKILTGKVNVSPRIMDFVIKTIENKFLVS